MRAKKYGPLSTAESTLALSVFVQPCEGRAGPKLQQRRKNSNALTTMTPFLLFDAIAATARWLNSQDHRALSGIEHE